MTHLNSSSKVVNHPDALLFRYSRNLLIDGHFEFSNGLWFVLIDVVLQEPPKIKKKSGDSDRVNAWSGTQRLLINWLWNVWSSHTIVIMAECEISPSCWNHCTSCFTPRRVPSALQNLFCTSMKCTFVTVTASFTAFSNQNGPIILCFEMTTQVVHFKECKDFWSTSSGTSAP